MSHEVRQTRRFSRQYKKLHDNIAVDVDAAVEKIAENPDIGDRKKGDLAQLLVFKFRCQGQLYLLGYTMEQEVRLIYLETVGPHENFYRDLKR
ncbi:MAG: addiction module toxin RelE [Betaproteobacteria bacterium HGW-Betaproteobacteria-2]|nr:MAG: addiction module toxin RelE [Betaproteobacteria bacterium HGW-Betaproteobacteria-2]